METMRFHFQAICKSDILQLASLFSFFVLLLRQQLLPSRSLREGERRVEQNVTEENHHRRRRQRIFFFPLSFYVSMFDLCNALSSAVCA